jgi:hypothetical protein
MSYPNGGKDMAKFVKLFVALAALCILVLPAFSMPDYGMIGQDGNQKVCDCQKHTTGDYGKACDGQKSMIGADGKAFDGKKPYGCAKSMMGNDGKAWDNEKFKMGFDKEKQCGCNKEIRSMMGEHGKDGKLGCNKEVRSMMDGHGKDGKLGCNKEIRSMMGGHGKDGFKAVLVSVRVIQ